METACQGLDCPPSVTVDQGELWKTSSRGSQGVITLQGLRYLRLVAHACDRDYAFGKQQLCVPQGADRARTFRTFQANGEVKLMRMPELATSPQIGFLSLGEAVWGTTMFKRCDNVFICAVLPFTWDFKVVPRLQPDGQVYPNDDIFSCGASMFRNANDQCEVDPNVVPFFRALCGYPAATNRGEAYSTCSR
eukprot:3508225-Rhodomonas_salina.1